MKHALVASDISKCGRCTKNIPQGHHYRKCKDFYSFFKATNGQNFIRMFKLIESLPSPKSKHFKNPCPLLTNPPNLPSPSFSCASPYLSSCPQRGPCWARRVPCPCQGRPCRAGSRSWASWSFCGRTLGLHHQQRGPVDSHYPCEREERGVE